MYVSLADLHFLLGEVEGLATQDYVVSFRPESGVCEESIRNRVTNLLMNSLHYIIRTHSKDSTLVWDSLSTVTSLHDRST